VVTVTGGSNKRVSLAALIAVKPGQRPQLIYRVHTRRRGEKRKGFTEKEYARLLDTAHAQLARPVILVWDNLNAHVSGVIAELVAGQTQHQRADRAGEDPAAADAVQARPPRGLPRPTRLDLTPFCNPPELKIGVRPLACHRGAGRSVKVADAGQRACAGCMGSASYGAVDALCSCTGRQVRIWELAQPAPRV
jgi:hypothetical protein